MTAILLLLRAVPAWVYVLVVMAGSLGSAAFYERERAIHWEQQSDQRDVQIAHMKSDSDKALALAAAKVRVVEQEKVIAAEEIANETDKRIADAAARAAGAERAAVGLRATIAALNRRPAPADPEARTFADEAGVARELLGTCSDEYTGLAKEADGLRVQVMGLQEFVVGPAGAGK